MSNAHLYVSDLFQLAQAGVWHACGKPRPGESARGPFPEVPSGVPAFEVLWVYIYIGFTGFKPHMEFSSCTYLGT